MKKVANNTEEKAVWLGSRSQWTNVGFYITCGLFFWLVIPIFMAIWRYLKTRCFKYEITNERIIEKYGVFSKVEDDLELFRITDVRETRPFFLRLVGLCNIYFVTTDRTDSVVGLIGVPVSANLKEKIREIRKSYGHDNEIDIV